MSELKDALSVSDWITFLSSEKHGINAVALSLTATVVSLVALILSSEGTIWGTVTSAAFVATMLVLMWTRVLVPLSQRSTRAEKLLKRIMKGELRDSEAIRREWSPDGEKRVTEARITSGSRPTA